MNDNFASLKEISLPPLNENDVPALTKACMEELTNAKAKDLISIDLGGFSSIADTMVICSGTSNRHVCAIAYRLQKYLAQRGIHGVQISGDREGEWVIADVGSVIVHIFQPEIRERYRLEDLYRCMAAGESVQDLRS